MSTPRWLPLLLGLLTAVGPISTDMYLPAFPQIAAALGGHAGAAQITLAAWFAGLAIGQITQGALSDRFGRRAPIIMGTALYALANAGCALAPDLATFSAMRLLSAIGGSAGMVIPRAIVRDIADGPAASRMLSRLILVMGAAPILAPSLGGLVLQAASWHAIFWVTAAYGAICCAVAAWALPETLPPNKRLKHRLSGVLASYIGIAREREWAIHAFIGGFTLFGLFGYLGAAPSVYLGRFGLSPSSFAVIFGAGAASFIAVAQLNPPLTRRFGVATVMRAGIWLYVAGAAALAAGAALDAHSWLTVAIPIALCLGAMALALPNAAVGALSRHAAHAGSASALMGTLQFCLGAVSGLAAGLLDNGTVWPLAILMLLGASGAAMADLSRAPPRRYRAVATLRTPAE